MADAGPWQLQTPTRDGQVVLWPAPSDWPMLARRSAERLNAPRTDEPRLLGLPLSAARRQAREQFPAFAGPKPDPDRPWVVTGHQTFPYHAGVWAKNVAAHAAAAAIEGLAVNLNVDHDLPRAGFQLQWPRLDAAGRLTRCGDLALDHRQPFERQPAPSPEHVERLCRRIDADLAGLLTEPRTCPFTLDRGTGSNFAGWFAAARTQLDRQLGVNMAEAMFSRLCHQDAFLLFFGDIVARAEQMRPAYNESLAEVRQATGFDPAADLRADDGRVELPFWSLRPDLPGRRRLFVRRNAASLELSDEHGEMCRLDVAALTAAESAARSLTRALADCGVEVRPRALTLTLFARLLLADLFIHGIGGAHYDTATDGIFRRFYKVQAAPFAVASATLLLPMNVATATADQLRLARHRLRDMRFNPQRHIAGPAASLEPAATLISARGAAIERNQALRSLAAVERAARRRERADLFARIRGLNRELAGLLDDNKGSEGGKGSLARQQALVNELSEQRRTSEVALARDYFYGLFPAAKLHRLRESITGQWRQGSGG